MSTTNRGAVLFALVVALAPGPALAQELTDSELSVSESHGILLLPKDGLLAVSYQQEDRDRALADLLGEPLGGLSLSRETNRLSLFAHPDASAAAELFLAPAPSREPMPRIQPLIDRLIASLDGPYVLSPVYGGRYGGFYSIGDDVLIQFEPSVTQEEETEIIAAAGGVVVRRLFDTVHLRLPGARRARDVFDVVDRLAREPAVLYAQPNLWILHNVLGGGPPPGAPAPRVESVPVLGRGALVTLLLLLGAVGLVVARHR